MKNSLFKHMVLHVLLIMPTILPFVAYASSYKPVWHDGDQWTVKAVFPSDPVTKKWNTMIKFDYTVKETRLSDAEYIVIGIRNIDHGRLCFESQLHVKKSGFYLTRADVEKSVGGKRVVKTLVWDKPVPVCTQDTLTPFDFPKFPLVAPSSQAITQKRQVDKALTARESITQTVRSVQPDEKIPGIDKHGALIEVKCLAENGRTIFVQYWDTRLPWPVYGENDNMKYWLDTEGK